MISDKVPVIMAIGGYPHDFQLLAVGKYHIAALFRCLSVLVEVIVVHVVFGYHVNYAKTVPVKCKEQQLL